MATSKSLAPTSRDETASLDDDANVDHVFGQLSFSDSDTIDVAPGAEAHVNISTQSADEVILTRNPNLLFEVTNAAINTGRKSKFVVYTILLKHFPSDRSTCTISKRYSEFAAFFESLKQMFPDVIKGIELPPKHIIGNFKAKTIAERSRCFEQFLSQISSHRPIRTSTVFLNFFYGQNICSASRLFVQDLYSDALPLLIRVLKFQQKLIGDPHKDTTVTTCAVALCYNIVKNDSQALTFCNRALQCMASDNDLLIPTLTFTIRLSWTLGKDKIHLEEKLRSLQSARAKVEVDQTLLEMVKDKCREILMTYY